MRPVSSPSLRRTAVVASLLGLALGPGCRRTQTPAVDPSTVATVNGEVLAFKDFDRELARDLRAPEGDSAPPAADVVERVRRSLLERMVGEMLLLQTARQLNLAPSAEEVDRRVARIKSDYAGEQFSEALEENQLTPAEHQQKTTARLTLEKLMAERVYPRVAVTEEELRQEFDKNPEAYTEPERVRAAQIVVKNLDEAQRVLAQLRGGKRFEELARKYSLSADAKVGGDLGFFPRGVMPAPFDDAAFRLGVGQVSEVVPSEYGFHIFKVLERKPARKRQFGEVREKIETVLLAQKRAQAEADFRQSLRDKADVKINETALARAQGASGTGAEERKSP